MEGYLDPQAVATRAGVKPKTIHQFHTRGDMPKADEYVGRTPVWKEETIAKWLKARPGHGWRAGKTKST